MRNVEALREAAKDLPGERPRIQLEQEAHGEQRVSEVEYVQRSRFCFESFQNWHSEFLAVGSIVLISVWLRQRGSPESKPVDAAHTETG